MQGSLMSIVHRLSALAGAVAVAVVALPAHALGTGDVGFTYFNADADTWYVGALADLPAHTVVYFTDNEWNGQAVGAGGAFNTGEAFYRWDSGAQTVAAGTVIAFSAVNSTRLATTVGQFTREAVAGKTATYGLSQTAETIYAYQGSDAATPAVFVAALSTGNFSDRDGTLANTGLTADVNAVQLPYGADFGQYQGAAGSADSIVSYRARVANRGGWQQGGDGSYAGHAAAYADCLFTPTPEPGALVLMMAGAAALASQARRRKG